MIHGLEQQKLAVQSGSWPVYRYDPRLAQKGENPLQIECKEPTVPVSQYAYNETRYKMLTQMDEGRAELLMKQAQQDASTLGLYEQMHALRVEWQGYRVEAPGTPLMTIDLQHVPGLKLQTPLVASASCFQGHYPVKARGCRRLCHRDVLAL
jgi:hypothetical protein